MAEIVCEGLIVRAPGSDKVLLDQLSFTVAAGEHLAVVGVSGAGKSTLLNVLLGFLAYEGSLRINGVELRELSPEFRHRLIQKMHEPIPRSDCLSAGMVERP
jgi:ATP-binding cassette subfamily C protein CydD